MRRFSFRVGFGLVVLSASALACVVEKAKRDPIPLEDDDNPGPAPTTEPTTDPGSDASAPRVGRVYAHTASTLYLYEPFTKKVTSLGAFDCLEQPDGGADTSMIDIAINGSGQMFGTTFAGFVTIDASNASCSVVKASAGYPNSLAFVPAGTVDPSREALVGYAFDGFNDANRYVRIDTTTGQMTDIGKLNPQGATTLYESSGDIVAIANDNNRAFLTVRVTPDVDTNNDLLAEIDPTTGALKRIVGDTGFKHIYGFGYWAGRGYGFDGEGHLIQIDMVTGAGTSLITYKADGGAISWYGAGTTTQAPTTETAPPTDVRAP